MERVVFSAFVAKGCYESTFLKSEKLRHPGGFDTNHYLSIGPSDFGLNIVWLDKENPQPIFLCVWFSSAFYNSDANETLHETKNLFGKHYFVRRGKGEAEICFWLNEF